MEASQRTVHEWTDDDEAQLRNRCRQHLAAFLSNPRSEGVYNTAIDAGEKNWVLWDLYYLRDELIAWAKGSETL
jgi:hypothetical protein